MSERTCTQGKIGLFIVGLFLSLLLFVVTKICLRFIKKSESKDVNENKSPEKTSTIFQLAGSLTRIGIIMIGMVLPFVIMGGAIYGGFRLMKWLID